MNVVAYQGEPGAFSEEAALALGGDDVQLLPCHSFHDVVDAVRAGRAARGVLPVHNSLIGPIVAAHTALEKPGVRIVGELTLPIHHCLLAQSGTTLDTVRIVVSHPAALAQCKIFFETQPHLRAEPFHDTAGAAKHVANVDDATLAAIASQRAADRYGLTVLARDIEDASGNRTQFCIFVCDNHLVEKLQHGRV